MPPDTNDASTATGQEPNATDVQPAPSQEASKPLTTKDGCGGCFVLLIGALLVVFLFSKCFGGKSYPDTFEGRMTRQVDEVFGSDKLEIHSQVDGGYVIHVKWNAGHAGLSAKSTRVMIFGKIYEFLSALPREGEFKQVLRYWFDPQINVQNDYGATSWVPGAKIIVPREELERIQWDKFNEVLFIRLVKSGDMVTWHPAMIPEDE